MIHSTHAESSPSLIPLLRIAPVSIPVSAKKPENPSLVSKVGSGLFDPASCSVASLRSPSIPAVWFCYASFPSSPSPSLPSSSPPAQLTISSSPKLPSQKYMPGIILLISLLQNLLGDIVRGHPFREDLVVATKPPLPCGVCCILDLAFHYDT